MEVRLRHISAIAIVLFTSVLLTAEGTRTWEQSKFDELSKGTAKGVALRSAGGMELAPAFTALTTTPSIYIWAIAADQSGNLYVAAGSPACVYRISPAGKSENIFQPKELQVQALVVDKIGAVYAATNPDGKIYRIEHRAGAATDPKSAPASGWSSSIYFDPGTKYIWDVALDNAGNLYVATGDHGEIFRVTAKDEHSVFFKSDETHIRVLAFDPQGNLIAGSDGSGLVYRISPAGEGFVLYSAPKKEITALAIDRAGNIYAAGAGEKRSNPPPISFPPLNFANPAPAPAAGQPAGITITNAAPNAPLIMGGFPGLGMNATGGSEIYRLAPDGSPSRLWSSREDLVYALVLDAQGHLLAGTGNRGHVFEIIGEDEYTDLLKASATQVTAFAKSPDGGIYAATSNLGKLFHLGAKETEGSYESDVFDAHIFSRWGRAEFRGAGNVELFARSGNVDNPDRNWSPWKKVDLQKDAAISVPAARFIQWKALLHAGEPAPRLNSVTLNYLPKNVAPDFDDVTVQLGTRYQPGPKPTGMDMGGGSSGPPQPHFDPSPPAIHDRDSIGVRWTVHDDNDDQMVYSVYYRGDGETRWLLLKDNLTDKFYSFDASLLPDGGYTIEVLASDAPSHSPGQGLTAVKDSARFEVDTTAPQIVDLHASTEGSQIHVSFRAVDSFSAIKRAEYSVDAGEWQFVEPSDQLSDSKTENYDFRVAVPAVSKGANSPGAGSLEHVVVVRAYDRYDNMSSAKTVIRGK
ncbi:MAG: hypothetical protein WB421_21350 [Terriglobales bacterium]